MNRKEIKKEAREKIKGNIWNILWPVIVIGVLSSALGGYGKTIALHELTKSTKITLESSMVGIISGFLSAVYIKYLLNFIRKGKFNNDDFINTIKEKWFDILIAVILIYAIVFVCTLLLVIPGIIIGLAYTMALYLVVDSKVSGSDSLKASREMMKGYKWNYFVFELSFLGWIILGIFTLGLLYIWLIPYINVASCLYYEKLKEIKN